MKILILGGDKRYHHIINSLKDKKLIDKNVCFVKVLARGIIDKPLIVKAQDFSLDAAKMIQLTGGKVVLLNKKKY